MYLAVADLANWDKWLILVITAGVVFRIVYLFLKKIYDSDESHHINKSIKHTLIAGVIMLSIGSFVKVLTTILIP